MGVQVRASAAVALARSWLVAVAADASGAARGAGDGRVDRADEVEPEAFARVVVDSAELRTGPGRQLPRDLHAHRGETFALDGRPGAGFWLRVLLPDGRIAYALGDEVQPFAVTAGEEGAPSRPGLFAPPPLEGSRGGLRAASAGCSASRSSAAACSASATSRRARRSSSTRP